MDNKFDNREFEQFLKQNADQYRMYPSQKVWKNIHYSLHTRKRWLAFGLVLLALSTATTIWVLHNSSSIDKQVAAVPEKSFNKPATLSAKGISETENTEINPALQTNSLITKSNITNFTNPEITNSEISFPDISANPISLTEKITEVDYQPVLPDYLTTFVPYPAEENNDKAPDTQKVLDMPTPANSFTESTDNPVSLNITDPETDNSPDLNEQVSEKADTDPVYKPNRNEIYPLSIESVLNQFKAPASKHISLQAYFTPTISFRKLSQNNSFLNSSANSNTSSAITSPYDINQAVTHKPGLGLEFGISARYPIRKNMKIKAGLQANINRYDIKAFNYSGEVATIALDEGPGINSVRTWSKYRNFTGYTPNWLQNHYFSVSVPVGAEVKVASSKKVSFGVAGSVQPTYIVHDRAYLITTDYKNYAEIPWLIRRLNVNTSMELFINYTSGKVKWQFGPQVRYQLLSSFQNKYPFKENLYNYGMKVGIMLKK